MTTKPACEHCPEPGAFSPSQIKLFMSCQRKWAFRHIANLPDPQRSFQTLGKEVHEHNENYMRHGTMPPKDTKSGQIAMAGIGQLPAPDKRHGIENHIFFKVNGVSFHGFVDLNPHDAMAVYDYKTTSSYQYAMTPEQLVTDPQALIYGMARCLSLADAADAEGMRLVWLYYKTKPPFTTRRVEAELSYDTLRINFNTYAWQPAAHMRRIRDEQPNIDPNTLPANDDACDAYGGCAFKSKCSLHQKATFGMNFADKMKAKKHAPANGNQQTSNPVAPQSFASEIAAIERKTAQQIVDEAMEQQAELTALRAQAKRTMGAAAYEQQAERTALRAQGVVPPDAPAPVAEVQAPKKRGRPKKQPELTVAPFDPDAAPAAVDVYDRVGSDEPPERIGPTAPPSFILCINTMPMGEPCVSIATVLQGIAADLATQLQVSHFRLADEAGYGRADALLLSAFRENAPILDGFIYADARDVDTKAILPHLEAGADMVFRGAF